jgi:hypothetical protein
MLTSNTTFTLLWASPSIKWGVNVKGEDLSRPCVILITSCTSWDNVRGQGAVRRTGQLLYNWWRISELLRHLVHSCSCVLMDVILLLFVSCYQISPLRVEDNRSFYLLRCTVCFFGRSFSQTQSLNGQSNEIFWLKFFKLNDLPQFQ